MPRRVGLRPAFCVAFLALNFFAGCVASKEAATPSSASSSSPIPTAAPATATDDTGSISVNVIDDELRPIVGASVAIIERKNESVTDNSGNATFNLVPPGTYSVIASRLGYSDGGKKVTVVAGQVAQVRFRLAPYAIGDAAYQTTVLKSSYIHASESILYGLAIGAVNVSAVRSLECEPCSHVIYFAKNPKAIQLEVQWTRSTPVPYINMDAFTSYKWNWTSDWYLDPADTSRQYITGYIPNGKGVTWSEAAVKSIKGIDRILLLTMAGSNGTVEQKEDFYTSFSYGDVFPENFTALPPKS